MIIVVNAMAGRLYVVATPIGNLGDLSPRAREILQSVVIIAAEDTRHTGALLKAFDIQTSMVSLHEHNEIVRLPELIARLLAGAAIALVSDAGTPAISDPGYELVRAAAAAGIEVISIPGPCAAVAALSISALSTAQFCFEGFLPARSAARRTQLQRVSNEIRTLVFYESPHRVAEMLADCVVVFGALRLAVVARELTKMHETLYRGSLADLAARALAEPNFSRGEIVVVIAGAVVVEELSETRELDRVLGVLLPEVSLKQAAHLAAKITGVRDNEAYKRALHLKTLLA